MNSVEHVRLTCGISQSDRLFRRVDHESIVDADFILFLSMSTTFYQVGLPAALSVKFLDPLNQSEHRDSSPIFRLTLCENATYSALTLMPPRYDHCGFLCIRSLVDDASSQNNFCCIVNSF